MQKLGDAPAHDHKWKSMERCPFCEAKGKSGVFNKGGTDFFKCHAPGCSSGNECVAEIGYIRLRKGLGEEKPATGGPSPAYKFLLELAGCYEEPKRKDGKTDGKKPEERPPSPQPAADRQLRPTAGEGESAEDENVILQCIEIVLGERKASVSLLQRRLSIGYSRATRIINELEKRGIIGPAKGTESGTAPRDILVPEKTAPQNELPNPVIPPEVAPVENKPVESKSPEAERQLRPTAAEANPPKAAALRDDNAVPSRGSKPEASPPEEPPGRLAMVEFYSQLSLSEADAKMIYEKRGLAAPTCRRLGFVSNPVENKELLLKLLEKYPADELLESGLFLPEDKKRKKEFRPNAQFYGMGQKGKKPKEERQNRDDRWVWGMVHPVILPYFDECGELVKLRPHKGGAPGNTLCGASRLYVPRDYKKAPDTVEHFPNVIVTEGEYKAASLWRAGGAGREDIDDIGVGQAWGVCAVPGINFGNNYDLRSDLDAWLKAVQCRRVVVAFDDQDKTGRPMRERHEALIWARFLACDLARTLHVRAKVLVLPADWRDEKLKSDWDGALAGMLAGKIKV